MPKVPNWIIEARNIYAAQILMCLYPMLDDGNALASLLPGWKKFAECPEENFIDLESIDELFLPTVARPLMERDLDVQAEAAFAVRFAMYPPTELAGGEFLRFLTRRGDISSMRAFLTQQRVRMETFKRDCAEKKEKRDFALMDRILDRLEMLQRKLAPEAERISIRKARERRGARAPEPTLLEPASDEATRPVPPLKPVLELPAPAFDVPIVMEEGVAGAPFLPIHGQEGLDALGLACEAVRMQQLKEFDQLLCQDAIPGVIPHRYQSECARRVLTRFRGRAILADEVGLGKTIEAGMVIKEYLMRGLAKSVLVLVPPALVGQWQSEMLDKFGLAFATTSDDEFRGEAGEFWDRPLVIASIGLARVDSHSQYCLAREYDLVVVDEAHHLKNAASKSHKLVKMLRRKFLLLLTATPIQNDLVELYNLINLLRPGTLGTQAEFKKRFVKPGHPAEPIDRDRLRELLATVMIRNTRGFVDVKLPRRFASTRLVQPSSAEAELLEILQTRLREAFRVDPTGRRRLVFANLLGMAGSSPAALRRALDRARESDAGIIALPDLPLHASADDGRPLAAAKDRELFELLRKAPGGKVLVFTRFTETLGHLQRLLDREGIPHSTFHGGLDGPARDRAVEAFRNDVPVMLATETGGEGRNLQFCNTLVNYDLPWNPMRIEQRIGRLHRIGQTRDVFIFNLCLAGTIEERILKVLEEKINLFELVVGEADMILGHLKGEESFEDLVLDAWLGSLDETERTARFEEIASKVARARRVHETVKSVDDALFRDEFEV